MSKKINFLYICRLFNGFETSIESKMWSPTGVPTIYRVIDELDSNQSYNLDLVITSKNFQSWWNYGFVKRLKISGLSTKITILSSIDTRFGKLGMIIQELFHLLFIFFKVFRGDYDVVYIDHANIFTAAFIARMQNTPVVFRIMGVYPAMRSAVTNNNLMSKFLRWCYSSPFSMVICTQDGSGIEPWLNHSIGKDVVVYKIINGVEYKAINKNQLENTCNKYNIPTEKTLVLYLGKLEEIKGIYKFIEGFDLANKECNKSLHAIIIGYGCEHDRIKKILDQNPYVTFIPRVSHSDIFIFHEISDIYISPNRLANLTNANLEAMVSGSCIVIPESQPDTTVDFITDKLLDSKAVYRIKYPPTGDGIAKAIIELFNSSELRSSLSHNVLIQSKEFITSWDKRVNKELHLIKVLLDS
ncbi:glycosyltransferase [bacterium]|nr:glycosyltransferase [bacterium]